MMILTWAEDRATLASDPSADPGARPEGVARRRPSHFRDGIKALNATVTLQHASSLIRFVGPYPPRLSPWVALDYASCGAAAGHTVVSTQEEWQVPKVR
jgi:hypothetical protein